MSLWHLRLQVEHVCSTPPDPGSLASEHLLQYGECLLHVSTGLRDLPQRLNRNGAGGEVFEQISVAGQHLVPVSSGWGSELVDSR